ncbi:MAG: hypothetical protein DRQ48_05210 [Gammaproteobacteria bacterium]|nr:MAG: hypothetical protein DRQ48_05210 [Gammaproteobacteria bacterium]
MRWIKKIFVPLIVLFAVFALIAGILLTVLGDDDYRKILISLVNSNTELTLAIEGGFTLDLSSEPSLTASQVSLQSASGDYDIQIDVIEAQIKLSPLLDGILWFKTLKINDVDIHIDERTVQIADNREDSSSANGTDFLVPLIERAAIQDLELIYRRPNQPEIYFNLNDLQITDENQQGTYQLSARGELAGNEYSVDGQIQSLTDFLQSDDAVPLNLNIIGKRLTLSVIGTVSSSADNSYADLELIAHTDELGVISGIFFPESPVAGNLSASARLHGVDDKLSLKQISLKLDNSDQLTLDVSGDIADIYTWQGTELEFSTTIKHEHILQNISQDIGIGALGELASSGRLSGSGEAMQISGLTVSAITLSGLKISASGETEFNISDDQISYANSILDVEMSGPTSDFFSRVFKQKLSGLGNMQASYAIAGDGESINIENIKLKLDNGDQLQIELAGKINNFSSIQQIDLNFSANINDPDILQKFIKPDILPEYNQITLNGNLKNLENGYRLDPFKASANIDGGMVLNVDGTTDLAIINGKLTLINVNTKLQLDAPSTSQTMSLIDIQVPYDGHLKATGELKHDGQHIEINNFVAIAGSEQEPVLKLDGSLKHDPARNELSLESDLLFDPQKLFDKPQLFSLDSLGTVKGKVRLVSVNDVIKLEELDLTSVSDNKLSYKLAGTIENPKTSKNYNFNSEFTAKDLRVIGDLFGKNFIGSGVISGKGVLQGDKDSGIYKGNIQIGKSDINTDLHLKFDNERPSLSGSLSSSIIHLEDFDLKTIGDREDKKDSPIIENLFLISNYIPIDSLGGVDLSLKVDIEKVTGTGFEVDTVDANVSLDDRLLEIKPLKVKFEGGSLLLETEVNTREGVEIKYKLDANDVPVEKLFTQFKSPVDFNGTVNMLVDLQTRGQGLDDIAENLNGTYKLVLENGQIQTENADFFMFDLFGMFVGSFASKEDFTKITCAVASLDINNGIAETQALQWDTPTMKVAGTGTIDLKNETIDLIMVPDKKKLVGGLIVTPIKISGPIRDPEIEILSKGGALGSLAGAALLPQIYIPFTSMGRLFNMVVESDTDESPCL